MSDYIPEEILVQILKRLPVKTLVRFRCVCKWWKQLIDSPSLVLDHLALQKPRYTGLNIDHHPRDFLVVEQLTLLGALHGIVCLYEPYTIRTRSAIFLWNPSMRKLLNVPVPKDIQRHIDGPTTYSAFWIDPLTKDFKIIVFKMAPWEKYGAIYSSIEGDWKELCVDVIGNCWLHDRAPAVLMGKVAYWRACHKTHYPYPVLVISFDFEHKRFGVMEGPLVLYECRTFLPSLHIWQGRLSLAYLDDPEDRCDIFLWREGSWANLFRFRIAPNINQVLCILEEVGEAVSGEEMQENCKILALTSEDDLVTFDTRVGCVRLRGRDESCYGSGFVAYDFVESLLFP